jgi:hypothetical protein
MRISVDKVCTKDSCWSVGTIYDYRELPEVNTVGTSGRGVTVRPTKTFSWYFLLCWGHTPANGLVVDALQVLKKNTKL